MIRIFLGLVGSGKTACVVREMELNPSKRVTFTNIKTVNIPNVIQITQSMIIKKKLVSVKKNGEKVYTFSLNKEFWQLQIQKYGSINVILDEAHTLMDSRRTTSKYNKVMSDFLAMIRRILGQTASGYGELTLITQLDRRLDIIAREMATHVRYHRCHYQKGCQSCGYTWNESNDEPEPKWSCPSCGNGAIRKQHHIIEVFHFSSIKSYEAWSQMGMKTYHSHYYINDIEDYFDRYSTIQWENMITDTNDDDDEEA